MTERGGGCIILLDIPPGSAITLDGVTRVTPSAAAAAASAPSATGCAAGLPFHRGLWIIGGVPRRSTPPPADGGGGVDDDNDDFHLLVVRSGVGRDGDDRRMPPVGFVLSSPSSSSSSSSSSCAASDSGGHDWVFARKYDRRTEEISDAPLDEVTLGNLVAATRRGGELENSVIPYDRFMMGSTSGTSGPSNGSSVGGADVVTVPAWETRTSEIDARFLRRCHGLSDGDKIVPSSEGGAGGTNDSPREAITDGTAVSYPCIPCIDATVDARRLTGHVGTRRYLSTLSPAKRTWLLFGSGGAEEDSTSMAEPAMGPGEYVWSDVLRQHYRGDGNDEGTGESSERDFLADVELSFLLFLFMECHASLEHWRDAVSMCSLAVVDDDNGNVAIRRARFFRKLLRVLHGQLSCIETEFFREEADDLYSSGADNFLIGALRRLCDACESFGKRKRDGDGDDGDDAAGGMKSASRELRRLVRDRFGVDLSSPKNDGDDGDADADMEIDALGISLGEDNRDDPDNMTMMESLNNQQDDEDDDDEEDGPTIVPYNQIEASLARSSLQSSYETKRREELSSSMGGSHREEYPLLYAAMSASGEDEVMACARILDEAKDVSLVREAAAYLEEVEACR
mmetsp:Transcript_27837/g.67090  ORF Transcript_27837/g.67090 Transcript_27837/m.67090 type:complete len:626 (+) Transcript_27837:64-1941(+)